MTDLKRDELLIRLDERTETSLEHIKRIDRWCSNHDAHHFRYNIMAWSAAIGAIVALILLLYRG